MGSGRGVGNDGAPAVAGKQTVRSTTTKRLPLTRPAQSRAGARRGDASSLHARRLQAGKRGPTCSSWAATAVQSSAGGRGALLQLRAALGRGERVGRACAWWSGRHEQQPATPGGTHAREGGGGERRGGRGWWWWWRSGGRTCGTGGGKRRRRQQQRQAPGSPQSVVVSASMLPRGPPISAGVGSLAACPPNLNLAQPCLSFPTTTDTRSLTHVHPPSSRPRARASIAMCATSSSGNRDHGILVDFYPAASDLCYPPPSTHGISSYLLGLCFAEPSNPGIPLQR